MAKTNKMKRKYVLKHSRPNTYQSSSYPRKVCKDVFIEKRCCKISEKKDWEDVKCSVCMEFPHNGVLLLCSSYNKGCHPYMCATSHRYSNCLEQYKKAYTKVSSHQLNGFMDNLRFSLGAGSESEKIDVPELLCPLCRGQVKGWTVVESAREYLNAKKRNCMQDKCSFCGTYKELRKHVKSKHPLARPRAIDPVHEEKWKNLECERERNDVISTIISSIPGAVVLGDYVLEPNQTGFSSENESDSDDPLDEEDNLFSFDSFNLRESNGVYSYNSYSGDYDTFDEDDFAFRRASGGASATTAAMGRGFRRMMFSGPRRQRYRRGSRGWAEQDRNRWTVNSVSFLVGFLSYGTGSRFPDPWDRNRGPLSLSC